MADTTTRKEAMRAPTYGKHNDYPDTIPEGFYGEVQIDKKGNLKTNNSFSGPGLEGALSVGLTAVEAKVGASVLAARRVLTVFNNSGHVIYWGRTSSVTVSTGTPIFNQQFLTFDAEDIAPIYLISAIAGSDVRLTENT